MACGPQDVKVCVQGETILLTSMLYAHMLAFLFFWHWNMVQGVIHGPLTSPLVGACNKQIKKQQTEQNWWCFEHQPSGKWQHLWES